MQVRTLGEAWRLGCRVRVRCVIAVQNTHNRRYTIECNTSAELDVKTLVWTRGEAFPTEQLASRLRCPRCGNRTLQVVFEVPNEPSLKRAG